jgi:hypothetical protein
MKFFVRHGLWCILAVVTLQASSVLGQIDVGIKCDASRYIIGERIVMEIQIRNSTDEPLVFNDVYHNAELELSIIQGRQLDGIPIRKKLKKEFVIMTDDTITKHIELNPLCSFQKQGCYQVRVSIYYGGRVYTSSPFAFDVIDGIELTSRRRMLKNHPNVTLTYSLRYIGRDSRETAFMVIQDKERGELYGTFRLGPLVRVYRPALTFDGDGNLVCVHQSGYNRFSRSVISVNENGAEFLRQTQHLSNGDLKRARKKIKEAKLRG